MADDRPNLRYVPACDEAPARPPHAVEVNVAEVIERVIEMEIRSGKLTPARRRRLVRYAASLGLSAREAGELVQRCAERAAESDNPLERRAALRLVRPPADRRPWAAIAAVVILAFAVLKIVTVGVRW